MSEEPDTEPTMTVTGRLLAGSELKRRIVSGIALGAVALAFTYWSPVSFTLLIAAIAAIMSWEWGQVVRGSDQDAVFAVHGAAVVTAAVLTAAGLAGLGLAAVLAGAIAVAALLVGTGKAQISGIGVLYTGLPVIALGWLRGDGQLGFLAVLFIFACVIATDVAAYFTGRTLGGPKLMPSVSPNKTWSGLIGGVTAAAITGALFAPLSGSGNAVWLAVLGLLMGLVSQGGDLIESALKRSFGLKDASGLIPGHGGFMDRMDGIVTAGVVAALLALMIDAYAPARALLYGS